MVTASSDDVPMNSTAQVKTGTLPVVVLSFLTLLPLVLPVQRLFAFLQAKYTHAVLTPTTTAALQTRSAVLDACIVQFDVPYREEPKLQP